jgi:hypothetical protein
MPNTENSKPPLTKMPCKPNVIKFQTVVNLSFLVFNKMPSLLFLSIPAIGGNVDSRINEFYGTVFACYFFKSLNLSKASSSIHSL